VALSVEEKTSSEVSDTIYHETGFKKYMTVFKNCDSQTCHNAALPLNVNTMLKVTGDSRKYSHLNTMGGFLEFQGQGGFFELEIQRHGGT